MVPKRLRVSLQYGARCFLTTIKLNHLINLCRAKSFLHEYFFWFLERVYTATLAILCAATLLLPSLKISLLTFKDSSSSCLHVSVVVEDILAHAPHLVVPQVQPGAGSAGAAAYTSRAVRARTAEGNAVRPVSQRFSLAGQSVKNLLLSQFSHSGVQA